MADVVDYQIFGDDIQIVEIGLDPGEGLRAEAGAMMYMESGVEIDVAFTKKLGASVLGGLMKGDRWAVDREPFARGGV